jgi:hypothetical protein
MVGASILAMILEADVSDTLVVEISLSGSSMLVAEMPR